MSVVTASAALPELEIPGRRFAKATMDLHVQGGSFDQLPQAAQRILLYMWQATNFGADEVWKTTAEIAKACDRCERWVYKAIRQCLDHLEGGVSTPLITKRFVKGPREVAGRVLGLAMSFVAKKTAAEPNAKRPRKAKGDQRPATATAARSPGVPPADAPARPPEQTVPLGAIGAMFRKMIGGVEPAAKAPKTEAERAAEADGRRDAYLAAAERRKAEAARKAPGSPEPIDSS